MQYDDFIREWHSADDCLEVQTSGSTGAPKRMRVEKHRMLASAAVTCDFLGLRAGDRALLCLPLDYIAGKMMVVRAIYRDLQLTVIDPGGHPLADVGESGFDFAAMVPLQVYNSLAVPAERERLSKIRHLIIGGGAVDDALAHELADMPNAVWSTYGMTETLSHIAMRRVNGPDASDWYTPLRNVQVSVDADSRLCIYAPDVCAERLVTNDVAEIAPDGRFRVLGRIDNVICCGGVKMQIEEIERLLQPVMPCAFMVTSRPDPKFGEVPVLLYEASESPYNGRGRGSLACAKQINEALLRQICAEHLPKYMQPKYYICVSRLPLTPNGKPARAAAREIAAPDIYPTPM